jgi:UDP-N-acetylglucosamine 2-epimerase (non-hydrolysing)
MVLLWSLHPRANKRRRGIEEFLSRQKVIFLEPSKHVETLSLIANSEVVLTDSGGIQEETTALGVPCLTLRESTERPITVTEGTNQVVGTDPERIVSTARVVLRDGVPKRRPQLWDGHAAQRIVEVIVQGGRATDRKRPTDL